MNAQEFMTQKLGPLPVWAYLAVGGGTAGLVVLYQRGHKATTATAAAGQPGSDQQSQQPWAPSPIVINSQTPSPVVSTPATMPDSTSSVNQQTGPNVTIAVAKDVGDKYAGHPSQIPLYGSPAKAGQASGDLLWVGPGTQLAVAGALGAYGIPVIYVGQRLLVSPSDVDIQQGPAPASGMGGGGKTKVPHPSTMVRGLAGLGQVTRMLGHHAHSQFVHTGRGGLKQGQSLPAMARRTGVPLVRLQALNQHLRTGRDTYVDGVVHIA